MTIPDTCAALVLSHGGRAETIGGAGLADAAEWLEYRQISLPDPGPDQVLIRVALSPVNPSDLLHIRGEYGLSRQIGMPAGFEGVGTVIGTGKRAQALAGRRVSFLATGSGAWAEYALADAAAVIPVSPDIADSDAAALIVNPLTAIALVGLAADSGTRALVLTAANSQLCRLMIEPALSRNLTLIAIIRKAAQAAPLHALGVQHVLDSSGADFAARLGNVCRSEKPRILLDAVGDQIAADIFAAMPAHSRWISYGLLSATGPRLPDMRQFVFDNKRIEGFWLSRWLQAASPEHREKAEAEVQTRFASGVWSTAIGTRLTLQNTIRDLGRALRAGGKVMIAPDAT
ncbi:MAG: zinc-binding dehydrogenase [Rhodobacteraceae bacterium]|nr:zinc-binding dehydrogenase [Paracoccaceae bacterium]